LIWSDEPLEIKYGKSFVEDQWQTKIIENYSWIAILEVISTDSFPLTT
jgi:sulfur carrier protein ThiS